MGARPRIDFITLGVSSLDRGRRFYVDGLGWPVLLQAPEIVMVQVNHGLTLGLFAAEDLSADAGGIELGRRPAPMSLALNFDTEDDVVAEVARWEAAGATVVKPPQRADYGGFHAYVQDPCGFLWELGRNPGWFVDPDGTVRIVPIEP